MPPLVCKSCQRTNPEAAEYCYFDGAMLRAAQGGTAADRNRLSPEFYFPSGRRCANYDELVQGCQEEWAAARDMLQQGMFSQYFNSLGRQDLVKASREAQTQQDPDVALSAFLSSIPSSAKLQGPKLDVNPRKLDLGKLRAGDGRKIDLKILNRGRGTLQGSLSIVEGSEWLRLGDSGNGQCSIKTSNEQNIRLTVDTRGLPSAQTYGAKLRVITNGGVDEIPIQMDITANVFAKPPFHGAKTPREMAVKMRDNAKAAVQLIETGELSKWFASNGWNYPVSGQPARGVAGVQQFFEAMGLSKPPKVKLSQPAIRLPCRVPDRPQFQVTVFAQSKKWVYANVVSDVPWVKVLTPNVTGAQKSPITLEIDPKHLPPGNMADGLVQVTSNGGQKLPFRVVVDIQRPKKSLSRQLLQPLVTLALALMVIRLILAPFADGYARYAAVSIASVRAADNVAPDSPSQSLAGWLQLPWASVLLGTEIPFPEGFFGAAQDEVNAENFRDYFVSNYVRILAMCSWWLGTVIGGVILWRRNGWKDGIWGMVSGSVLGLAAAATLACVMLVADILPLAIWGGLFGSNSSIFHLVLWVLFVVMWWAFLGLAIGFGLLCLGPIGKAVLTPIQEGIAGLFRLCGLKGLATFCSAD